MLSYKLEFSSCGIMSGFGKSSHNYRVCLLINENEKPEMK